MQCTEIIGPWTLKDAFMPKDAGSVFSTFSCAGGSTMGYKLAGFDVIANNEIDPKIANLYSINHHPKYSFVCSIRDLIEKEDLPEELYNLDILDGSPPCTSFSTSGVRDRDWGKAKKFDEGQALQRLDDLFFEFIALAKKLQPKIIVAENVLGLILGKAKGYVKEILKAYDEAGYTTQVFKLNASNMGVPQARTRIFFLSHRKDLNYKPIKLNFKEKPISFGEACEMIKDHPEPYEKKLKISPCQLKYFFKCKPGDNLGSVHPKGSHFDSRKMHFDRPAYTLTSHYHCSLHPVEPRVLNINEVTIVSSFPMDMNWNEDYNKAKWAMGMSVPPFMTQRIALEIRRQWLNNA